MPILAALPAVLPAIGSFLMSSGGGMLAAGALGAGASLLSGKMQADASKNALGAMSGIVGPYAQAGQSVLPNILGMLGIGPNGPDPGLAGKIFGASPDYQFAHDQGMLGVNRDLASKGLLNSGAAVRDTSAFNQGLASQTFGNYFQRLMGVYNTGAQTAAGFGDSTANLMTQRAGAQAGGLVGAANQFGQIPTNMLIARALGGSGQSQSGYTSGPMNGAGPGSYATSGAAASGMLGYNVGG